LAVVDDVEPTDRRIDGRQLADHEHITVGIIVVEEQGERARASWSRAERFVDGHRRQLCPFGHWRGVL
jgi:hypothetical protein